MATKTPLIGTKEAFRMKILYEYQRELLHYGDEFKMGVILSFDDYDSYDSYLEAYLKATYDKAYELYLKALLPFDDMMKIQNLSKEYSKKNEPKIYMDNFFKVIDISYEEREIDGYQKGIEWLKVIATVNSKDLHDTLEDYRKLIEEEASFLSMIIVPFSIIDVQDITKLQYSPYNVDPMAFEFPEGNQHIGFMSGGKIEGFQDEKIGIELSTMGDLELLSNDNNRVEYKRTPYLDENGKTYYNVDLTFHIPLQYFNSFDVPEIEYGNVNDSHILTDSMRIQGILTSQVAFKCFFYYDWAHYPTYQSLNGILNNQLGLLTTYFDNEGYMMSAEYPTTIEKIEEGVLYENFYLTDFIKIKSKYNRITNELEWAKNNLKYKMWNMNDDKFALSFNLPPYLIQWHYPVGMTMQFSAKFLSTGPVGFCRFSNTDNMKNIYNCFNTDDGYFNTANSLIWIIDKNFKLSDNDTAKGMWCDSRADLRCLRDFDTELDFKWKNRFFYNKKEDGYFEFGSGSTSIPIEAINQNIINNMLWLTVGYGNIWR